MHPLSFRQNLVAALLIFIGAVFFSTKAIIIKLAYLEGVDSISLLTLRMLFSLPAFLAVAWYSRNNSASKKYHLKRKDWWQIAFLGMAGYYLASLFDFLGLKYVTASLERLILFVYPTMVLLISAIFFKEKIYKRQFVALLLTYLGIAIAFLEGANLSGSSNFALGGLLVFGAGFMFAIYIVGSGHLLPRVGTFRYTSYAMTAACFAIVSHHAIMNHLQLFHFAASVYWHALLMAVIATFLPSFMVAEGIRIIGSNNAAIIGSIGPISTIVLACIFLGEHLGTWQWLGTFFVIAGVLLLALKRR